MDFPTRNPGRIGPFLQEFRKIGEGIYEAPDDFLIILVANHLGSLYEPFDERLRIACAGITTQVHFPLDEIYNKLKASRDFDDIWELFRQLFYVFRDTDIKDLCSIMPGVYQVPRDLRIMRMVRQDFIGGYSFQPHSRYLRNECHRLFNLKHDRKNLRLAEIYAGLWMLGESNDSILAEIFNLMDFWLLDDSFRESEEGMLSKLVMLLGKPVNAQSIANILKKRILAGNYVLTKVLPYGNVSGEFHWSAKFEFQGSFENVTTTLQKLVKAFC